MKTDRSLINEVLCNSYIFIHFSGSLMSFSFSFVSFCFCCQCLYLQNFFSSCLEMENICISNFEHAILSCLIHLSSWSHDKIIQLIFQLFCFKFLLLQFLHLRSTFYYPVLKRKLVIILFTVVIFLLVSPTEGQLYQCQ